MGFFDNIVPSKKKLSLIRTLAASRLSRLPAFSAVDYIELEKQLESLPMMQVMSLPEATVVQIMETVSTELRSSWLELVASLERHRAQLGKLNGAALHTPFEYAVARVLLEHEDASKGVTPAWAREAAEDAALARIFREVEVGSLVPRRVVIGISPPMPTEDCRCQSVRNTNLTSGDLVGGLLRPTSVAAT